MTRFSIYFAPTGNLATIGAQWLGYDLRTGNAQPSPAPALWVAQPAHYGFHATIKAPFRLKDGPSPMDLAKGLAAICKAHRPITLPLRLDTARPMAMLKPRQPSDALSRLAADAVTGLDRFRRPSKAADLAKRTPSRLPPRHRALLAAWGYPYVLDAFDFHITVTAPLPRHARASAHALLEAQFSEALICPLVIDRLALCEERPGKPFRILTEIPLGPDA